MWLECTKVKLTNDGKGQICAVDKRRLLGRVQDRSGRLGNVCAASNRAHACNGPKDEEDELDSRRSRLSRHEAVDNVHAHGQLHEALDPDEGFKPRLVAQGEQGVAGGGDVLVADGDEEVQRRRGCFPETLGVKVAQVKDCRESVSDQL